MAYPDLWRAWVKLHEGEAGAVQSSGWYLGPSGEHLPFYGAAYLPPESAYLPTAPTAPNPSSIADIRHDPDLLDRYYRGLDVYRNALGRSLTDAERQGLANSITSGRAWNVLDELRERQLQAADERYRSQAEDFGVRHPGFPSNVVYNPTRPAWTSPTLTPPALPATDPTLWAGSTGKSDTLSIPTPLGTGGYIGYPAKLSSPGYVPPWQVSTPPPLGPTHVFKFEGQWYDPNTGQFIKHEDSPLWQIIDVLAEGRRPAQQALGDFFESTYGTGYLPDQLEPFAGRSLLTNFRGLGASRGDRGFRPEFQDDHLYADLWGRQTPESKQLGHFITAIDMGYNGSLSSKGLVIGHEQYGDPISISIDTLPNMRNVLGGFPFFFTSDDDLAAFNTALAYDQQGNPYARDYWLATIMDENRFGPQSGRQGNSMEDLRLTVKGWELGREIATGRLRTNDEVADWIIRNVAHWWY